MQVIKIYKNINNILLTILIYIKIKIIIAQVIKSIKY